MNSANSESNACENQLYGFGVLASVCARALVNEPDQSMVDAVRSVAEALGDDRFNTISPNAALMQRFYDRFFVTNSPFYVPLHESSVRGAVLREGRVQYAPVQGSVTEHVQGCYQAIGFDFRSIEGFDLSVKSLKPDSMASELCCMVSLVEIAVSAEEETLVKERARVLLKQFAEKHPSHWFEKAAEYMRTSDDDFYARICALATEGIDALLQAL